MPWNFLSKFIPEAYRMQSFILLFEIIEVMLASLLFAFPLKRKKHFPLRIAASIVIYTVVMAFVVAIRTHFPGQLWSRLLKMELIYLGILPLLFICFSESVTDIIKVWCNSVATVQIGAGVYSIILNLTGADDTQTLSMFGTSRAEPIDILIWLVLHVILFVGLFLLFGKTHSAESSVVKDISSSRSVSILSAAFIVVIVIINTIMNEYRSQSRPLYEVLRLCIIVFSLSVLVINRYIFLVSQGKAEISVMEQVMSQSRKQYDAMKANIELVNIRCHDLRHQLEHLQDKLTDEEMSSLKEAVDLYDSNIKTGNETLDVVLYSAQLRSLEDNITFSCMANGECLSFMHTRHLYSLFSNALSNAMEAVLKIPDSEKRVISLHVRSAGQQVEIAVLNYFTGELTMSNGRPVTSKAEKNRHGFGVSSMQYIVNQYGGTLTATAHDEMFTLRIMIPIPDKE